jgi:hypothetical protein
LLGASRFGELRLVRDVGKGEGDAGEVEDARAYAARATVDANDEGHDDDDDEKGR